MVFQHSGSPTVHQFAEVSTIMYYYFGIIASLSDVAVWCYAMNTLFSGTNFANEVKCHLVIVTCHIVIIAWCVSQYCKQVDGAGVRINGRAPGVWSTSSFN